MLPASIPWLDASRETFVALGAPGLFAVAFLEFFLFPVPPDLVLVPLALADPALAPVYAAVATAGSVLAGVLGFALGRRGGRPVLESRFAGGRVERAEAYVERYGLATVAFGAFAPIPEGFEVLSVASGVLDMDFRTYLAAALVGRGGKYALEAALAVALGDAVRSMGEPELYAVTGVVALLALAGYLLWRWRGRPRWGASAE